MKGARFGRYHIVNKSQNKKTERKQKNVPFLRQLLGKRSPKTFYSFFFNLAEVTFRFYEH